MTGPGVAAWEPAAREGEPVEGLALGEWVGQALGAASMCWADVGAAGEFDSSRCGWIFDGLMAHINAVIAGAGAAGAAPRAQQALGVVQGRLAADARRSAEPAEPGGRERDEFHPARPDGPAVDR